MIDKLQSNALTWLIFLLPLVVIFYFLPFDFFVNVKSIEYKDMCAGSDRQVLILDRDVNFADSYQARSLSEMIKIKDQERIETTIKRKAEYIYQKSDTPVVIEIKWSEPVLNIGTYTVEDYVQIEALGFTKSKLMSDMDNTFKVINCDLTE